MAKEHLTEVDYIRVILIFTLVGFHAFAPFCGAWPPISDTQIPTYWWVGKFYYSFMLEAFVFISGYVFGFQVRQKGAQLLSMNAIVRSKLKRLLLPSIVFSIIYLLIFGLKDGESIAQACYSIIDGRGHMWFLPMLFWCFIYIAFVEKFDFRTRTVVIAAFTCSFLSFLPLPFRMGSALYYFPFFYVGYAIRHKELKISNIAPPPKKTEAY
jgi:fucose 4-O-acetylase-like acetyltransferase